MTRDSDRMGLLYSYIAYKESVLVSTYVQQRTPIVMERRGIKVRPMLSMFNVGIKKNI